MFNAGEGIQAAKYSAKVLEAGSINLGFARHADCIGNNPTLQALADRVCSTNTSPMR
jgi:hypothetical protein